ncbi:hypothetical protein ADL28_08465 [Streptomyces violaceusniger]|uniref:Uncharacterized protein n=1 Tax=Streptomyces violaceusniger TaxID=68280 RepID=A0A0X3X8P8_STRVO|nr:hypothetical protein ADL28_08465 [Streptomyces violaceusniger]
MSLLMAFLKGSRMGFIRGEWKAWLTVRVLVFRPLAAQVVVMSVTGWRGPEMTVLPGVLCAAMLTWLLCRARSSVSSSGVAAMVAMLPPAGSVPMRVARVATRWQASGRSKTPAMWAAAISPMEWPMTASGRTPSESSRRARAMCRANSPVWV